MTPVKLKPDELAAFKEAFDMFDRNGDGMVTKAEFRSTATHMTIEQIDLVFRRCDLDKDGKLSFDEFERWGEETLKK